MACAQSKTIASKARPLYNTTAASCSYLIQETSQTAAAQAVAEAEGMPGYVRRSRFYSVPGGVRVYVYFAHS